MVTLKPLVKWLGVYFDENLIYKEHIAIKTLKACQAFYRMNRLANISRGLSPSALRQLYLACVTSIADYGAILWFNNSKCSNAKLVLVQVLQNQALYRILGVFKTTLIMPIEVNSLYTWSVKNLLKLCNQALVFTFAVVKRYTLY